ncbi:hypothetical protein B6D60_02295 [candidate division KSB1 bacterium 4484_87]|nr:MAG: hypothetical protein B6D60_02295 [candidate division KSB1 bacterium 4484_87]
MMDAYLENIVAGIIRVTVLWTILFLVLPKLLLGRKKIPPLRNNAIPGFIIMSSFIVIIIHLFSLVRIYDFLSLFFGIALFAAIFFVTGDYGNWNDFFTRLNFRGLRILEKNIADWLHNGFLRKSRRNKSKQQPYTYVWKFMLAIVVIVAGMMRLLPVFRVASPFSIESYKTLEYVKSLGEKSLFYDQMIIPKGMHAIIDAVFQLSRVNPQTIIHIFGAISALMLIIVIYYIVSLITGNKPSALLAAAVFGVFPRLLPVSLEQQVEANTIVIASVFLLLGLFFIIEFFSKPSYSLGIVALLGIVTSIFISYFSAVIFAFFVPVLLFHIAFLCEVKNIGRRILAGILLVASLGGLYLLYQILSSDSILMATAKSVVTDELFTRFARNDFLIDVNIFFFVSAGLGIGNIILFILLKKNRYRGQFFVWGMMTAVLAILWYSYYQGFVIDFNQAQIGFILSLFDCVALGLVVYGVLFQFIENGIVDENVIPLRVTVWGLVVVLVFFEIFLFLKAPTTARFTHQTEPDGYVRALYKIEKEYDPFEWIVVSHFGAKIEVQNYGRFMDYLYFLKYYNPKSFNQKSSKVIPASHLFIFTEKNKLQNQVDSALLPRIPNLNTRLHEWCFQFARNNKNIHVFYEDEQVRIYRIDIPKKKKTIAEKLKRG